MNRDETRAAGGPSTEDGATVPADRRLSRIMGWLLLILAAAGGLVIYFVSARLAAVEALAEADPVLAVARIRNLLSGFIIANLMVTAAFAVYFVLLGRRVLRAGRYPPPGMKVLRKTRVRTGKGAAWIGRGFVLFALALLCSNLVLLQLYRILDRFSALP